MLSFDEKTLLNKIKLLNLKNILGAFLWISPIIERKYFYLTKYFLQQKFFVHLHILVHGYILHQIKSKTT